MARRTRRYHSGQQPEAQRRETAAAVGAGVFAPVAPVIGSVTLSTTTPTAGQTISATVNLSAGSLPVTYAYQWQSSPNGTTWTNAGTNSATSPAAVEGLRYRVTATATNLQGSDPETSAATSPAAAGGGGGGVTLSAPTIDFTSADSDSTPEATADLTAPQVGDVITWQRADDAGFTTNVQTYTDTLDSTEVGNLQTSGLGFGTWANGTYYNRAKHGRSGVTDSAWSSTVTKTIAVVGSAAHRYWRVYITADYGSATELGEVEWRVGGTNQTGSGTALGNPDTGSTFGAADAYDGNPFSRWSSFGTAAPVWIGYDFGSGVTKAIDTVALTTASTANNPKDFQIQYSDNGSTWTTVKTVTSATLPAFGDSLVVTVP